MLSGAGTPGCRVRGGVLWVWGTGWRVEEFSECCSAPGWTLHTAHCFPDCSPWDQHPRVLVGTGVSRDVFEEQTEESIYWFLFQIYKKARPGVG